MKLFLLSICLFLLSFTVKAQDKEAILKILDTQVTAWNKGDIDGFMKYYWKSDSLLFIGSKGPTYGWNSTYERYKKTYPDKAAMGTTKFDILKVDLIDPTNAFVLSGWNLKREKDALGGFFTLWFRKIDGKWVIVCDHTS